MSQKTAVLMVHYGTVNAESRAKTIDVINKKIAEAFPRSEVREAYSSKMVINALRKKGVQKTSVLAALEQLKTDGYKKVVVQTTNLLDGLITELIKEDVRAMKASFDTIIVDKPLLWGVDDCKWLAELIATRVKAGDDDEVILVGHGTDGPANAVYALMDYVFHDMDYKNFHVATIESYPGMDSIKKILKEKKAKHVILYPLLMIAGNHVAEDIGGRWKTALEMAGYTVDLQLEGLGELKEVQDKLIGQIKDQMK